MENICHCLGRESDTETPPDDQGGGVSQVVEDQGVGAEVFVRWQSYDASGWATVTFELH